MAEQKIFGLVSAAAAGDLTSLKALVAAGVAATERGMSLNALGRSKVYLI